LATDWGHKMACIDESLDISTYAPAAAELYELVSVVIESDLPYADAEKIPALIQTSGRFMDVRFTRHLVSPTYSFILEAELSDLKMPFGTRQSTKSDADIGSQMLDLVITHFDSLRPLCRERITGEEFEDLRANALGEMRTKSGMAVPIYMVVARKA
jgi:hypothetical protein